MVSQLKPKLKPVKMHVAYCRCQGEIGVFVAVAHELPDVAMTKQTVIPKVHGVYKHNKTIGHAYPNGVAEKNRTESGQNSVPVVHFGRNQ